MLFYVYFETRPETHGLLIQLDRQSKPLIIDTEQFVKNKKQQKKTKNQKKQKTEIIEFQQVYGNLVNLWAGAVGRRVAIIVLLKCKCSLTPNAYAF